MDLGGIIQLVNLKLGEQSAFYPQSEIVLQGINPAQRLMCLAYPALNYVRTTVTVVADQPFIDLRQLTDSSGAIIGNRFRSIRRVVLGNVVDNLHSVSTTTGELRQLRSSTVKRLAGQNDWLAQRGEVRRYWLWGQYWMGLYKRPIDTTVLTVIYAAAPTPFTVDPVTGIPNSPTTIPDTPAVYHAVIAEIATGLLLLKEGNPQSERGMARIAGGLNVTHQNPV